VKNEITSDLVEWLREELTKLSNIFRTDINIYKVEGTRTAVEMGNPKVFNMIVFGSYLKVRPILKLDNVEKGLEKSLPERYHKLIPLNLDAIKKGQEIVETVQEV